MAPAARLEPVASAMHLRCPHCQNAIELIADDTVEDLTCPSCGSQLKFAEVGETRTWSVPDLKSIAHFELLNHVGQGHFGDVWMARDTRLDRLVAVKVPRKEQLDEGDIQRFLHEARATAQLKHPHIVAVHEVGREADRVYIVSDFIRGVTLGERLTQYRPSPPEAALLLATIAEALHHAHQAGIVHRDLKPANIMLDGDSQPHIMDFGMAKRDAGEITMTIEGRVLGTPAYMSPEQARGEGHRADRTSDVYSLGVILYEMLTGQRPFSGSARLLLHQVLYDDPAPPRKLNRNIPRDLQTICLKAMAKDPLRRYPTAQAMADDLRRWSRGEPIHARPAGRLERAWRWSRRYPARAALAGTLSASVLLLGVVVWGSLPAAPFVRPVSFVTVPEGARIALVPLDEDHQPVAARAVRPKQKTPLHLSLPPGSYLVVAELAGYGFQEVYRRVPQPDETQGQFQHELWEESPQGEVILPPIEILATDSVVGDMVHYAGGTFDMGGGQLPRHRRNVDGYWLDPTEVTVAQYRKVMGDLPEAIKSQPEVSDWHPVNSVSYAAAVEFAERVGKRLMTEEQYEYAATQAGRRKFPWGDAPEPPSPWQFGPVRQPAFDRTPTDPPVYGLFSNLLEWTDSVQIPYPGGPPLPAELVKINQVSRVVRGGPASLVDAGAGSAHDWSEGPRHRCSVLKDSRHRGLGFRCAKGDRPRYLRP